MPGRRGAEQEELHSRRQAPRIDPSKESLIDPESNPRFGKM